MKTIMTKRFWTFCLCCLTFLVSAQSKHVGYDRIKAIKMSFIVEKSTLSATEEIVFWPIYDRYEDLIHKKNRRLFHTLKKSYRDKLSTISNSEAAKILKSMDSIEELKFQRTQQRNKVLIDKLGPAKVLSILYSEELFNKEMFHRSRNKMAAQKIKVN